MAVDGPTDLLRSALCVAQDVEHRMPIGEAALVLARVLCPGAIAEHIRVRESDLTAAGHQAALAMSAVKNAAPPDPAKTNKAELTARIVELQKQMQTLTDVVKALAQGALQLSRDQQEGVTGSILASHTTLVETVQTAFQQTADSYSKLQQQLADQQQQTQRLKDSTAALQAAIADFRQLPAAAAPAHQQAAQVAAATRADLSYLDNLRRGVAGPPPPPLPPPPRRDPAPQRRTDMAPRPGNRFVRVTLARGSTSKLGANAGAARADVERLLRAQALAGPVEYVQIQYRKAAEGADQDTPIAYIAELPAQSALRLVRSSHDAGEAGLAGWRVRWHLSSQDHARRQALVAQCSEQLKAAKHVQFYNNYNGVDIDGKRYTLKATDGAPRGTRVTPRDNQGEPAAAP